MTVVPTGWRATTLGAVGDYYNGRGFKKSEWRTSGGRPIIRIQNLTGSSNVFNHFDGDAEERYTARQGDLLVSWAATLGAYLWDGPEAVVNQHIFKVESRLDTRFHKYLLDHHLGALGRETHGSGMVHVTRGRFDALPIVVPESADEQRRIVAVLEDHLSRLDATDAYLAASQRRASALLSSALQALVASSRAATGPQRLGDVARWGSGGTPRAGDSRYYDGGTIPWAVIGDLDDGPLTTTARRITEDGLRESAAKWVPPGSVLVAMYGSIGKLGLPETRVTTNQAIAYALPHDGLTRSFLYWFLRSQRPAFTAAGKGGTQKNISQTTLKNWSIHVPDLPTQSALVAACEDASQASSRLTTQASQLRHRGTALRRALLTAAFTGRLTGRSSDMDLTEELAEATA